MNGEEEHVERKGMERMGDHTLRERAGMEHRRGAKETPTAPV